ncbi:MAG: hypothetical protein ACR2KK_16410 [Acidimicrobiales bacterium]
MTIDADGGHILIQEDPANNAHLARIVAYRIGNGTFRLQGSTVGSIKLTGVTRV